MDEQRLCFERVLRRNSFAFVCVCRRWGWSRRKNQSDERRKKNDLVTPRPGPSAVARGKCGLAGLGAATRCQSGSSRLSCSMHCCLLHTLALLASERNVRLLGTGLRFSVDRCRTPGFDFAKQVLLRFTQSGSPGEDVERTWRVRLGAVEGGVEMVGEKRKRESTPQAPFLSPALIKVSVLFRPQAGRRAAPQPRPPPAKDHAPQALQAHE